MNLYAVAAWIIGFFVLLGVVLDNFVELGFWMSLGILILSLTFLVLALDEIFGGAVVGYIRTRNKVPKQYRGRMRR